MKIIRPTAGAPLSNAQGGFPPVHQSHGRPQWLKDWIADKGRYVLLKCGHKDDLNDQSMIIIRAFGKRQVTVFCERCNDFVHIDKTVGFREYANIHAAAIPDEPLF